MGRPRLGHLQETSAGLGDINFGNLASAPTTQAYARLPFDRVSSNAFVNPQIAKIAGDVWISASQASNFQLDEGGYGIHTLVHEVGHSLGLSHPGAYNAAPGLSITYPVNAEYAQDTRAYSVMSYFQASSLGARHFDFNLSTTVYAATPLIHDIAAAQRIYGADMTTRTGDTVYGFNSNAGRDSFDFTLTPAPITAIWDAGGIDTLDASGYATDQIIDLSPASLSSIGGVTFDTAPSFEQVNINRAALGFAPVPRATYDANMAALKANPAVGRLTDNVGIAYGATIENSIGGSGNDTMLGNSVDNVIKGNAGNDIIGAGAGNDTLDGGAGDDTMLGGIGNDLFIVGEAGDVVTELADEGTDTVESTISYTLGDNVENLTLIGAAGLAAVGFAASSRVSAAATAAVLTGTGNNLANVITAIGNGSFILSGGAGNDTITGGDGDDVIDGGDGDDMISGGAGNDSFAGGAGADTFIGGGADDSYVIDDLSDIVIEVAGEGADTVTINVEGYALAAGIENVGLGKDVIAVLGNEMDNVLTGNALSNRLNGGAGDDRLVGGDGVDFFTGGAGNDVFVGEINATRVGSKNGPISLDVILDFSAGDKIDLSAIDAVFGLSGDQAFSFKETSANKNAGDLTYKIYNSINGAENALGFDIDGIDGPSSFTGPVTIVFGNVDGGAPDFAIALIGVGSVSTTDFMF